MAKVTWNGTPEILSHRVSHGSGMEYVFNTGRANIISHKTDIAHYMTSGGFTVELSKAEAAFFILKRKEYHLSNLTNADIAKLSGTIAKSIMDEIQKLKLPKKPASQPQTEKEYELKLDSVLKELDNPKNGGKK